MVKTLRIHTALTFAQPPDRGADPQWQSQRSPPPVRSSEIWHSPPGSARPHQEDPGRSTQLITAMPGSRRATDGNHPQHRCGLLRECPTTHPPAGHFCDPQRFCCPQPQVSCFCQRYCANHATGRPNTVRSSGTWNVHCTGTTFTPNIAFLPGAYHNDNCALTFASPHPISLHLPPPYPGTPPPPPVSNLGRDGPRPGSADWCCPLGTTQRRHRWAGLEREWMRPGGLSASFSRGFIHFIRPGAACIRPCGAGTATPAAAHRAWLHGPSAWLALGTFWWFTDTSSIRARGSVVLTEGVAGLEGPARLFCFVVPVLRPSSGTTYTWACTGTVGIKWVRIKWTRTKRIRTEGTRTYAWSRTKVRWAATSRPTGQQGHPYRGPAMLMHVYTFFFGLTRSVLA